MDAPGRRGGLSLVGALAVGSVVLAVPALVVTLRSEGDATAHQHADVTPQHQHAATVTLSDPVTVGGTSVRMELTAARSEGGAVLAGSPVTMRFVSEGEPPTTPTVAVERTSGDETTQVEIERTTTLAIDSVGGELYQLTNGESEHEHTQQGQGLSGFAGSAAEWATTFQPGSAVTTSADGRWVLAVHVDHPAAELIDVVAHSTRAIELDGVATTAAFDALSEQVWIATENSSVVMSNVSNVGSERTVPIGFVADSISFSSDGTLALVSSGAHGRAAVVDTATLRATDVGAGLDMPAWSPSASAFVGMDASLGLARIDGALQRSVTPSLDVTDVTAFTLDAEGARAVVVDRTAHRALVVDVASGQVMGAADTLADPQQVVMLGDFAIIRDGKAAALTWLNVALPDRSADIQLGTTSAPASLGGGGAHDEVLAAMPTDQKLLRVHVMMGRPMVMSSDPAGVHADRGELSRSTLVHAADGAWQLTTVLNDEGSYRVNFGTEQGVASFQMTVGSAGGDRLTVTTAAATLQVRAGETVELRFTVTGDAPDTLPLVAYDAGSVAQQRFEAHLVAQGDVHDYRASFTAPTAGRYQVFVTPTESIPIDVTLVATIAVGT